ncbi:MAG: hypothetical protein A3K59_06850 [Euryarchaeota archaeon RBG_19FT_COMBO_69_17]|nr:MAG: hypothetical protein A3K59_06850 [Euryarchaeota archaeon RBG_19FT_COMBO_69_17]
MRPDQEVAFSKVKDLSPSSKQVNLIAKVVQVGEKRRIESKFGSSRDLCEAVVGDETGTVILSLWDGQIGQAGEGDVLQVNNGYVTLVRGHMRLNVGKYGSFVKSEQGIPDVNKTNDLSASEHESPPRESRGGFGGGGFGGGRSSYGGGPPRERRDRGRRSF